MEYEVYQDAVESSFEDVVEKVVGQYNVLTSYEEFFKWRWLATKQKVFSFASYKEHVTLEDIKQFTKSTYKYCKDNYRGLPRGFQTGFMSFAVLACNKVDEAAIDFVTKEVHVHFATVEIPMIYDLERNHLYSLEDYPVVGCIYNRFKKDYIKKHFEV